MTGRVAAINVLAIGGSKQREKLLRVRYGPRAIRWRGFFLECTENT